MAADRGFVKAVWCDIAADFEDERDIDAFVSWCEDVGIGVVLPCVNHGTGLICYPSRLAPTAAGFDAWDPLGLLVRKCRAAGIEIHAWLVVMNWGSSHLPRRAKEVTAPGSVPPLQASHPDWFVVDMYGHSVLEAPSLAFGPGGTCFLDPGKAEVRAFLHDLAGELLEKYPDLDGVHLDYIRYEQASTAMEMDLSRAPDLLRQVQAGDGLWITRRQADSPENDLVLFYEVKEISKPAPSVPGTPTQGAKATLERWYKFCYCEHCLERFRKESGTDLPRDLSGREAHDWLWEHAADAWVAWRAAQVTSVVRDIGQLVRGEKGKALSAATFWNYPAVVRSIGQDWMSWVNDGLLDFVTPMEYWISPEEVRRVTEGYTTSRNDSGANCPIYPGILTSPGYRVPVEDVPRFVDAIKEGGAEGIAFFCYSTWSRPMREKAGRDWGVDYEPAIKDAR